VFEERIPTLKTQVRVDLGQRTIRVGAEQGASTFHFTLAELPMHEGDLDQVEGLARPRGYAQRVRGKKYRRALREQTILHYDVEVPVDVQAMRSMGREVPAVLVSLARALNLAAGTVAAKDKLAERDIEAWLDLGQNSVQLFESSVALRSALSTVHGSAPSAGLKKLATIGGRAVAVVDGLRSAHAGYQLLYGDDTPILDELERGNQLRAVAVGAKGALQFTTGVTGAAYGATQLLMLGGAAQATGFLVAAAGPVGIALLVGGLLVAGIELALVATESFGEHVRALRKAWKEAEREEFDGGSARTLTRVNRVHELLQRFA